MNPEDKKAGDNYGYLNRNYSHGHNELHTTMFFAKTDADRENYEKRPAVQKALNNPFQLQVYGVFITPSTMGLRMALPPDALPLWDADDKTKPLHDPVCSDIRKFGDATEKDHETVFAPTNFTRGSRAHATVLTADHSRPVQTGLDLVDFQYCEQACKENPYYRAVNLGDGWSAKMRYYGFGRFMFYLNSRHAVPTVFRKVEV